MNAKKLLALLLAVMMVVSVFAACDSTEPAGTTAPKATEPAGTTPTTEPTEAPLVVETFPEGDYVWKSSVVTMASNWNPHTYQTDDDSMPLDYTTVGLYSFIFNDELHPVEGKDPYEGYVIVPEMAAEMPVDVTAAIKASNPEFGIPESAEAGFAWKVALNPLACWDDGTPINAETYVESFKRLLDPKMLNYRAADWYGQDFSIAGAENYANQGRTQYFKECGLEVADLTLGADGAYVTSDGNPVFIAVDSPIADWLGGNSLADYVDSYADQMFSMTYWEQLAAATNADGYAVLTDETMAWVLDVITGNPEWGETEAELTNYLAYGVPYPETFDWSNVGVLATGEYELTFVLDKSLDGFYLLYNMSGVTNNLVKIALYDACLSMSEGAGGEEVWTSVYNTNLATSPSFGPYKISYFQKDKAMNFVKNDAWYGWNDGKHIYMDPVDGKIYPMYQTTAIEVQVVAEAATRKMMFMAGELMGYGLGADDYATLRQSEYCYATPAETIFFLILNGHMQAITERENSEGFDKATQDLEMLTNTAFHQAMGLSYDKDHFAATISPARSGALGIIGTGYIYDPDSGAKYRDSDQAKQVLCDFYSVDASKFASLDEAVASITGYDPEQAKVYFKQAFDEGIAAGYINDADGDGKCDQMIRIEYAMSGGMTDFMTKTLAYLNEKVTEVAEGTPFEGKIEFYPSADYGNEWSNKIRQGQTDTVLAGWSGSALNPFSLTDLYTNPARQYDAAWYDATKVELTINVPVDGANKDVTMTLKQWSDALNGTTVTVGGVEYNFGSGQADVETRLTILAACEGKILESYNYLPMLQDGSMALLSQQVFYVVEEYNPIMGRGGITYTKYNYNEADWEAYVKEQGGELKY